MLGLFVVIVCILAGSVKLLQANLRCIPKCYHLRIQICEIIQKWDILPWLTMITMGIYQAAGFSNQFVLRRI